MTIKVLLVSPRLSPADRHYCGEHAYTDTLLQHPPDGIEYYHHEDLLASGQIRKIKWLYRIGPRLKRWGLLPPDLWAEYLVSDFVPDVLHIHGFSATVRFKGARAGIPVILSTSTGANSDLKYYLQWGNQRSRWFRLMKRQYLRAVQAHDTSLRPERAARVYVWSEFARRLHIEEGHVKPGAIEVIRPGMPRAHDRSRRHARRAGVTFLFIGKDFVRKNGGSVLEAFRSVRLRHRNVGLIVVGIAPDENLISEPGVTHYPFLSRTELFKRVYPQADVLVLPSKAEGFGLVMIEAMSFGLPVIGMDAWAMKEVITDQKNGYLLSGEDSSELAEAMAHLADHPEVLQSLKRGALDAYESGFSISVHNRTLRRLYGKVLTSQSELIVASQPVLG